MWQAGLVFEEMARREVNVERRKTLQEMSQFCLNLNLSNQCRQLLQTSRTTPVDEMLCVSFHSLQACLRQQPYRKPGRIATIKKMLLKTVKDCRGKLPVLKDVFSYSEMEATDPCNLARAAQRYVTDGRYDDALLFLSLLKLTQQRHVLATWRDADVYVRVHVLVAEDRLLRCVGRDGVLTDFNVTAAKLMFRQAFEDVFCPHYSCQGQADDSENGGCREDDESDENETPRSGQDSLLLTTTPSPAARTPGHTLAAEASSADLDDYVNDALNVLLLHDPRDKEAERDARNLQAVLREICELKTALMCDEEPLGADRSTLPGTVTKAELLVFVVRSEDVSPEFSAWLREAVNTTTAGVVGLSHTPDPPSSSHRLVTLALNSSPLPPALQGHRSFPASSTELLELSQGQGSRSEAWVRAACKLFGDLIGLQMEEM